MGKKYKNPQPDIMQKIKDLGTFQGNVLNGKSPSISPPRDNGTPQKRRQVKEVYEQDELEGQENSTL